MMVPESVYKILLVLSFFLWALSTSSEGDDIERDRLVVLNFVSLAWQNLGSG